MSKLQTKYEPVFQILRKSTALIWLRHDQFFIVVDDVSLLSVTINKTSEHSRRMVSNIHRIEQIER